MESRVLFFVEERGRGLREFSCRRVLGSLLHTSETNEILEHCISPGFYGAATSRLGFLGSLL